MLPTCKAVVTPFSSVYCAHSTFSFFAQPTLTISSPLNNRQFFSLFVSVTKRIIIFALIILSPSTLHSVQWFLIFCQIRVLGERVKIYYHNIRTFITSSFRSCLSLNNKAQLYKAVIVPIWDYGTELRGYASKSNTYYVILGHESNQEPHTLTSE